MKSNHSLSLAAAFSLLAAGSSAARAPAEPEAALRAALDDARAAVAASPAKPIPSCADAKELETRFEMTVSFAGGRQPLELSFEYAGCEEEGRNDYLPPYTTRSYKGQDGYELVFVTNEGASETDVLLSKGGRDWVGRFSMFANADLVSGRPLAVGGVTLKDSASEVKGKAVLRDSAKPLYPELKACEAADWSKASGTGAPQRSNGKPETGYGRGGPSLVLLTKTAAYYYHEDCDICAEVTKCELATGKLSSQIAAHSISCEDMKPYSKDAVFDDCAGGR
jgi:hypothetical protein